MAEKKQIKPSDFSEVIGRHGARGYHVENALNELDRTPQATKAEVEAALRRKLGPYGYNTVSDAQWSLLTQAVEAAERLNQEAK